MVVNDGAFGGLCLDMWEASSIDGLVRLLHEPLRTRAQRQGQLATVVKY